MYICCSSIQQKWCFRSRADTHKNCSQTQAQSRHIYIHTWTHLHLKFILMKWKQTRSRFRLLALIRWLNSFVCAPRFLINSVSKNQAPKIILITILMIIFKSTVLSCFQFQNFASKLTTFCSMFSVNFTCLSWSFTCCRCCCWCFFHFVFAARF